MAKEEWGKKRVCPTTGKRFYDLNRNPIVSPYTGEVVEIDSGSRSRSLLTDKSEVKPETSTDEEEDAVVLEDEEEAPDMDLGDDVLEEDEEDTVALDDIADVAGEDDDN
ncbi:MAG: TIGR02300 family protein [Pseudomonadota bacterium]